MLRRCADNLLVSVVLAFISGAIAAFALSADLEGFPLLPVLLPVFLALALLAWRLPQVWRPLVALPLFFFVGLVHTHLALHPPADPQHISHFIQTRQEATLIGRVCSMVEFDGQKSRFLMQNEEILLHTPPLASSTPQAAQGMVQIAMPGVAPAHVFPGASVMVLAQLKPIRSRQTPGAFNYRLYMASEGIACFGWAQSGQAIQALEDRTSRQPFSTLWAWPERMRQNSAFFLQQHFPQETAGIYEALLIGSRVNIPPHILEYFKANGCLHILSISGLHMSLLGIFSVGLFSFLLKRSRWLLLHSHVPALALLLSAPILLLYGFLAGLNAPAVRAMLTALLVVVAMSLRAQRSMLHLLSAAALIILAAQPLALFTASFQLSFSAVLAIIAVCPRLPLLRYDQDTGSGTGKIKKIWRKMGIFAQSMLYISLAATAGTLPVLLYHFNRVSLIGPIMNLLIEPLLCYWTLPCGLLALPLIECAPELARLLLACGAHGIQLSLYLAEKTAHWPLTSLWTITPNFFEIFLYFLIFFLFLRQGNKTIHYLLIALASGVLLCSFAHLTPQNEQPQTTRVDILDVGQGNSALLRLPNGTAVLIDGGSYTMDDFDPGKAVIAPFLWQERLWRIDDLVISHPHSDHYNGLAFIIERFHPRRLIINTDPGEEEGYQALLAQAKQAGVEIVRARAGHRLQEGNGFLLECLGMSGSPQEESTWTANDRSLVLCLHTPWHRFLFPGDITAQAEQILLHSGRLLPVDMLLAPHHGSRYSASPAFIKALSPGLIVVSSGMSRKGTLPAPERLQQWQEWNIPCIVTANQGSISIISQKNNLSIRQYSLARHPLTGVGRCLPLSMRLPGTKTDKQAKNDPLLPNVH